ncbi:hypothetical protein [Erwinia amylovora]|uniref:Lipoprotein n=4 Tax=Erwinia amylovora TaxID=552 RepID=A0A831ETF2_ERWAM|nr:hypothetical protein [Erwinia amylovora]CBX80737.1 hypothetical protein predicted by Glimmer/Critica [Erwinia amylovora ATCC BAA-2158]CDK15344.1 hypothetical protein LA635_1720 [Erwinia amylovora LA635]CDK18710.1 hypothetical protein LA636_1718 [Erwinia amylovora LA636]CDK22080.1 hypothetical protein LA637_1720 [Erwinia amylovora LA637]ATZ11642.1 hypothetical protein AD997_09280 [Erwinia amylovora]
MIKLADKYRCRLKPRHLLPACIVLLVGCALKQYPASPPIDAGQAARLDCNEVKQQLVSQQKAQQQIDKTGEFDGLTVLGAVLDLGIGNGIAKAVAQKRANQRQQQLQGLAREKCPRPV